MAYSSTAFQATNLWQGVYDKLKQTKGLTATGGSTTTIVDTALSTSYQDDDLVGFTAFVTYDAGGAGAAPEGEAKRVSDYVASTFTLTTAAFTVAVAAGDEITLARGSLFPFADLKRLCNNALRALGEVVNVDTSLTVAASQTEYDVPSGVDYRSIKDVQYQHNTGDSDDNDYVSIPFKVIPDSDLGEADATIEIAQFDSGGALRIISTGPHVPLRDYDDPISIDIHPELAISACALACARWKADAMTPDFMQVMDQDYLYALRVHPIRKYPRQIHGMPHFSHGSGYPGDQSIYDRV